MIKFFRKIRQKLLSENKFSKYLIYAIGEIILVVIGILIALQINNWNESHKNERKQNYYLKSLKSDLKANRIELERVIEICNSITFNSDSLILLSERELDNIEVKELTNQILNVGSYSIFNNKSSTVRELMATGDLKLIGNDSLRSYLADWESQIEDIRTYELPNTEDARSHIRIVMKHFDVYKFRLNKPPTNLSEVSQLFTNREFMNSLAIRARAPKYLGIEYQNQKDRADVILKLLEEELKKK